MATTGPPPPRPVDGGARLGAGDQVSTPPGSAAPPPDWAAQTADAIERLVGSVRAKTAEPLEKVARALVYGLIAAIVGVAAMVLVAVSLVRGLDVVLPGEVWAAHALTGGIFVVAGLLLWRKRTVKTVKV